MSNLSRLSALSILAFSVACTEVSRDHLLLELPSDCSAQTANTLIEEQTQLGPLTDTHTLACALAVLRDTKASSSRSALASRLCLHLAERQTDEADREKFASAGVAFAEDALKQGGQHNGANHYYLAANLGLLVRDDIALAMENINRLEDEMKQSVVLSPDLDDGGPLRLLGALYLKAPSWPSGIGDLDKALEFLERAVIKHPDHPLNHLFYAEALWQEDEVGNLAQVKSEFALGEKLLTEGNWGYSKIPWRKEFAEFADETGGIVSPAR
ncbi:sterol transporter outer membrane protein BstC [Methylomonas sp. MgM2]